MVADLLPLTAVLAVAWAVLSGLPIRARGRGELSQVQVAFLRRGSRAAIGASVIQLFADGLILVTGSGVIARSRAPMRSGGGPLARAVYAAIPTPTAVRALPGRSRVRAALVELKGDLAAAGLVPGRGRWAAARVILVVWVAMSLAGLLEPGGSADALPLSVVGLAAAIGLWFLPRRTVAGYRQLARLRRLHARVPPAVAGDEEDDLRAAVSAYALHSMIPAQLSRAFARTRAGRRADDHPSTHDYGGGWARGGWEP